MVKVILLYGSPVKLTKAHKLVTGQKQPPYYVRAKVVIAGSLIDGIDAAAPAPGEVLLNSVLPS